MTVAPSPLVVGTVGAAILPVAVMWYLWNQRQRPGATYMFYGMAAIAAWAVLYAAQLATVAGAVRRSLEVLSGAVSVAIPAIFLAFALEYTGRSRLIDWRYAIAAAVVPVVDAVVVATNGEYGLMWAEYAVEPTLGAAVATVEPGVWLYAVTVYSNLLVAVASILLADTILNYGSLYRSEGVALLAGVAPVGLANAKWALGLGPVPGLNLTPVALCLASGPVVYALYVGEVFEFPPAVRRVGEQAAIDDFDAGVFVVDDQYRIVEANVRACAICGAPEEALLKRPVTSVLGMETLPVDRDERIVLTVGGERRQFALAVSRIDANRGTEPLGYTVLLQDVTVERRRQQRLEVLNRVLRHNLRNDMMVLRARADTIASRTDDEVADLAEQIDRIATDLLELGERARDIDQGLGSDDVYRVDLAEAVGDVVAEFQEQHPEVEMTCDVGDAAVRLNWRLLQLVLETTIENGIEHNDSRQPRVDVTVDVDEDTIACRIADNGPGIPDHELDVLESGEDELGHGSGLDLWVLDWSVGYLGGDLSFETDAEGTTVVVELPRSSQEPRAPTTGEDATAAEPPADAAVADDTDPTTTGK